MTWQELMTRRGQLQEMAATLSRAKSEVESILLASKNERQKIVAIKVNQVAIEIETSQGKVELPDCWHRRIGRWI